MCSKQPPRSCRPLWTSRLFRALLALAQLFALGAVTRAGNPSASPATEQQQRIKGVASCGSPSPDLMRQPGDPATRRRISSSGLLSLDVFPGEVSLPAGQERQLTVIGTYSNGERRDLTTAVQWTSASPKIANVNPLGLARAKGAGEVAVCASLDGITNGSAFTVIAPLLQSLEVSPSKLAILLGLTQQFEATGVYSDGSRQDLTERVNWESSNGHVAVINSDGLASSKDNGSTTITASFRHLHTASTLRVLPMLQVNYFSHVNEDGQKNSSVRITHPGSPHNDLCAMVYVFDQDQQMSECCGCLTSPNALRTFSLEKDLTSNPLTGIRSINGTIKIVSADSQNNPACNAARVKPTGAFRGWATHIQEPNPDRTVITEAEFQGVLLTPEMQASLEDRCHYIHLLGSGQGICSCGRGE
jgi:hypothetical protein